jgi:hypothetical protein
VMRANLVIIDSDGQVLATQDAPTRWELTHVMIDSLRFTAPLVAFSNRGDEDWVVAGWRIETTSGKVAIDALVEGGVAEVAVGETLRLTAWVDADRLSPHVV